MPRSYVTTAIPYVNADPHIGFALELVLADAVARHRRARGADVRLLTGTDDNSDKSVRAAQRAGIAVRDLVDGFAQRFRALAPALGCEPGDFISTSSDPRHAPGVERLWRACAANGDLYRGHYSGDYCGGCERFLEPDESCDEHPGETEHVDEDNWFFRLSRYGPALQDLIESGRLRVVPAAKRNEVLGWLRAGLRDFSVSRPAARTKGWGVPVPDDPSHVMYVWFDALGNYVTALDFATDGDAYAEWWTASDERLHVIGPDIVRFHALYWPAMLLSAGEPLPTTILCHGFVTSDGRKMSKSLGNVADPFSLADEFGADAIRWFLLRHVRTTRDGDFTRERFVRAYESDLADQLGNLVSRVVSMVGRWCGGAVPAAGESPLGAAATALPARVDDAMARFDVDEAAAAVLGLVEDANRWVVERAPWSMDDPDERADVLGALCETLRVVARELAPFLPAASREIAVRLGPKVVSGPPLFPKGSAGARVPSKPQ